MEIIDYTPRDIIVSIGGKEYPLAKRTEKTEKALREHNRKVSTTTQYESDMDLVRILLGNAAMKELFPLGEDEDLDRLHLIAVRLSMIYESEYQRIEAMRFEKEINQLDELSEKLKPFSEIDAYLNGKRK